MSAKSSQLIKLARVAEGISQDELASRLEVSKNYISLVENNRREPSLDFLKRASIALEIPFVLLMWNKSECPKAKTKEEQAILLQLDKLSEKLHLLFAKKIL